MTNARTGVELLLCGVLERCECAESDGTLPLVQAVDYGDDVALPQPYLLHWTGECWQMCTDRLPAVIPRWPSGHAVRTPEQQKKSVEWLVAAVNAVPLKQWLSELRAEQQRSISSAEAAVQEGREALARALESLRRAECDAVAAELAGTPAGHVAFKLLGGGWPGSAEELRETVVAVLSLPEYSPGTDEEPSSVSPSPSFHRDR